MTVEHEAGVTLWRRIESALSEEIVNGAYPPGARLPTEMQLAARFGANRHTIRRAVRELKERGLVRVEQGRGTFVHESAVDYQLGKRTRFSANLLSQDRRPSGALLDTDIVTADAKLADALELGEGAPVIRLRTLNLADEIPISIGMNYFAAERFDGIQAAFRETHSITRSLAGFGITDYVRKQTRITARMPTAEEARLLKQPPNRPLLQTTSIDAEPDGRPIQFGVTRFAGDRVQFLVDN